MFSHILAELRLAFGLLNDPEFLHAPYIENNVKILELFEAGNLAESAATLGRLPGALRTHRRRIRGCRMGVGSRNKAGGGRFQF